MADAEPTTRKLNARQLAFVAAYLGSCRFNATKAAIQAGYSEKTAYSQGFDLLRKPEIQAAVQEWRDAIKTRGIANMEYRIAQLDELEKRYWMVIAERADELGEDQRAQGGKTGLIVKQHKIIGGGENAQFVTEYVADTALTKEIRAIYDDVAKELGQRVEKTETKHDATESFIASLREFGRGAVRS